MFMHELIATAQRRIMSHDLCHLSDNDMSDHAPANPMHHIIVDSLFAPSSSSSSSSSSTRFPGGLA